MPERVQCVRGTSYVPFIVSSLPFLKDLVHSGAVQEGGHPSSVPHSHTPAQQERGDSKLKQGDNQLEAVVGSTLLSPFALIPSYRPLR